MNCEGEDMSQEDILKMAGESGFGSYAYEAASMFERFAELVAAKAAQEERKKHQADIERWKGEAAKAEKWRGLALAKDGDGRTVQRIQREAVGAFLESREAVLSAARSEEREACAEVCENCVNTIWEYHDAPVRTAARNVCVNLAASIRARSQ